MKKQIKKWKHIKKSKALMAVLCIILVPLVTALAINVFTVISTQDRIITESEATNTGAQCILVLGAGVWGDRPSPMLEDRLLQGIQLYNTGASDRLLVSGDHGSDEYDEVNIMKKYAIDRGVPSEHIFMDHAGFDTYNSIYRARDIFQAQKLIIVTQKYHLYRALYIADSLGLNAYGVASDPRIYTGQIARDMREVLARIKDFATTVIKPQPYYLGAAIPVTGNGDVTNDK